MAAMKVEKSLFIVAPAKDESEEWTKEMSPSAGEVTCSTCEALFPLLLFFTFFSRLGILRGKKSW